MPTLKVNGKLGHFLAKPQPIKVVYGGRGSGKSIGLSDMAVWKMQTEKIDVYCLREFQESIQDSLHRTLGRSINERLELKGWDVQESKIISPFGNRTTYKGASRNTASIQGAEDYRLSIFSEAHQASEESLDRLLPTILRKEGAQCWFEANPQSSEDAFSQRFIVPYQQDLDSKGWYEDDLHFIVVVNWRDNPWWNEEQEMLRKHDFETMTRAKYDWIWEGKFNDSIENSLIQPEWFDACIDAHVKLGFKARGLKMASHDPSDTGADSKGYAMRQGSVVMDIQEMITGNVNEGAHWACGLANQHQVDAYTWDCDGLGAALAEQTSKAFESTGRQVAMFKGSEKPDFSDNIYEPSDGEPVSDRKKIGDVFKNKRAQYYGELRKRIYNTYLAVEEDERFRDESQLLSFSSDIKLLQKLRSEVCRMPIKPNSNGLLELYTKDTMRSKFNIASPNLGDSVMMLMRAPVQRQQTHYIPKPIQTYGRR